MVHLFFLVSNYSSTHERFGFWILNTFLICVYKSHITDKVNQRQKTSRPLVIRGIAALKQAANSQKNNHDRDIF